MSDEDSTITVTKNGTAVGVMITPDRYISLLETIEILSDSDIIRSLNSSENDFIKNKTCSHKDVWAEYHQKSSV
jgi:PHD/YefM family antitoxin component YafN of YafNO toxin-antitoxin module